MEPRAVRTYSFTFGLLLDNLFLANLSICQKGIHLVPMTFLNRFLISLFFIPLKCFNQIIKHYNAQNIYSKNNEYFK